MGIGGAPIFYNLGVIAGGGGRSSCISSDGTTKLLHRRLAETKMAEGKGVPADGVRDLPDVSFFAGNALYGSLTWSAIRMRLPAVVCHPGAQVQTFAGVGGTSAGTPAMAGVMVLINQKYGRQGNADPTLYRLASSSLGASIFHDITTDNNRVACLPTDPDCILANPTDSFGMMKGYDSTSGYDLVTGLGSIDIANLVNNWTSVTTTPTATALKLNGGSTVVTAVHGSPIAASANVTASSGIPSGDVPSKTLRRVVTSFSAP